MKNLKSINITLDELISETEGMNPVQFESYCESKKIYIEWLDVSMDLNEGFYNVTLPDYNDANVFASDGSEIEITENC